jgi:hypothetical protein
VSLGVFRSTIPRLNSCAVGAILKSTAELHQRNEGRDCFVNKLLWKLCDHLVRRLRLRRLKFVREQFFLAAVAQNIKRLVRFLSQPTTPTMEAAT